MAMGQILNDTALLTVSKREFKKFDFTGSAWRFIQRDGASDIMR
jgi:hypothetical protein